MSDSVEKRSKREIADKCIEISTHTLLNMANQMSDGKLIDPRLEVLLASIIRAVNCSHAIQRLDAERPYSEEMSTLLRSLTELAITAAYLQVTSEEEFNSYIKYDSIMLAKSMRLAAEVKPEVLELIPQSTRKAFAKHVEQIQEDTGGTISGTSWTKINLHARALAVDKQYDIDLFKFLSRVVYPYGHAFTHSNFSSLRVAIEGIQRGNSDAASMREDADHALFGTSQVLHILSMFVSIHKGIDANLMIEAVQNKLDSYNDAPSSIE